MSQEKPDEKISTGPNDTSVGLSGSEPAKNKDTDKSRTTIDSAAEIPVGDKIGWKRVSELDTKTDIKNFQYDEILKELYYNDLWLYSGVVFVSLFSTWFIVLCGGGIGWIIILCAFIATYLNNSVTRFYRNVKSDVSREIAKVKLEEDDEKVEWLNEFLRRFWLIYEPVLSTSIIQIADVVLAASTPGFLDSLKLTNFTLGTKPPTIESVKSYPKEADDEVIMDWKISFVPNDLSDMTKAQLVKKVNPKVILTVRVGRGIVGTGIPILLEDMTLTGLLRVKLKLIPNFPHVETIDLCFLEEPVINYVLKPIGGETLGFDIGIIPGLSSFIRDQVHATLRPMMYAPRSYTLATEHLLYGFPIESSIGVLKLTFKDAKSLRNAETFGTSDPYCKVLLQSADIKAVGKELTRTKYISNSLNPVWNETHYLLFNNLNDSIKFQIYDSNGSFSTDSLLGDNIYPLENFAKNPNQSNSTIPVMHAGKQRGELNFDAIWYPIVKTKDNEPVPESNTGILKFNIHQAKKLDPRFSMVGLYNPYVELKFNGKDVFRSRTFRRSNDPTWEEFFEIFITDKKGAKLELNIRDERDFAEDPLIGSWSMSVDEFLRVNGESKIDWFDVKNARSGKIRLSCQWKPVILDHVPENSGNAEPLGIVKLHIKKATDLKNVAQLRGKSDPYIRIMLNSTYRGRTNVRNDNLNPIWDEYFYIPIHSLEEKLFLHCFDHENHGKDRNLGFTEFELKGLIKESDDGKLVPAEREPINNAAPLDTKGSLFYSVSFHPVLIKEGEIKEEENKENNINVLEYQSGILIININQANYKKKHTYIEVFVDDNHFPVYNTLISEQEPHWYEDTDVFIKNLDSSKIKFNIKENSKSIGKVESNVKKLLEECLNDDKSIQLPIQGMGNFKLDIGLNYIPVKYHVESDENINNKYDEHINKYDAENINNIEHSHLENKKGHAANAITDGVSKVGSRLGLLKKKDKKSKEEIKTEEDITPDKSKDDEVVPKSKEIEQESIPPNPQENSAANHVKEEKQKQSEEAKPYNIDFKQIEENRESTIRHVEFEEKPPSKSAEFERKQDEGSRSSEENGVINNKSNRISTYSLNPSGEIVGEPGSLTIIVFEAKNLIAVSSGGKTSDSYVKVKMNGKKDIFKTSVIKKSTSPKWDEHVTLSIRGDPVSFLFCVRDRNYLSKDVELGQYELHLWDHIRFNEYAKDIWVPLSKGNSQLHIKLNFIPSTQNSSNGQVNETNNSNGVNLRLSGNYDKQVNGNNGHGLTSKFSIRRKK
ncbi:C2 domain-containing protein [Glomus cerebriforme]|uniref:C2 domain-containing protein n=1 Tax=Glomus cerebriforme TaxID=658196 RepID=A0A397T8H1_9GLOM|nr:C2 domain-containing protein [Glomus cerebriforme]